MPVKEYFNFLPLIVELRQFTTEQRFRRFNSSISVRVSATQNLKK